MAVPKLKLKLRIPLAKRVDVWYMASEVEKGGDDPFTCGCCNEEVVLKKGNKRVHHFAHAVNSECGLARGDRGTCESMQHRYAKHILRTTFSQWEFACACLTCESPLILKWPNVGTFSAVEEWNWKHGEFFLDVAIMKIITPTADIPLVVAALEVLHTHAIGKVKRGKLEREGLTVVEVHASEIITAYEKRQFRARDVEHTQSLMQCARCFNIPERRAARRLAMVVQEFTDLVQFDITCVARHAVHAFKWGLASKACTGVTVSTSVCSGVSVAVHSGDKVSFKVEIRTKFLEFAALQETSLRVYCEDILKAQPCRETGLIVFDASSSRDICPLCSEEKKMEVEAERVREKEYKKQHDMAVAAEEMKRKKLEETAAAVEMERKRLVELAAKTAEEEEQKRRREVAAMSAEDPMFSTCESGPQSCALTTARYGGFRTKVECWELLRAACACSRLFWLEKQARYDTKIEEARQRGECIDSVTGNGCAKSKRRGRFYIDCHCRRVESAAEERREFNSYMMNRATDMWAAQERVCLNVPFEKKDVVKEAGGRWSPEQKKWHLDIRTAMRSRFETFWTGGFRELLPYLRAVDPHSLKIKASELKKRKQAEAGVDDECTPAFVLDFCAMLELNPESTRDTARVRENVQFRVSPSELDTFVHRRCDRPQWTQEDCLQIQQHVRQHRRAINKFFSLDADDETTFGVEVVPRPYFWGMRVKASVLRDRPSGVGIRVLF